MRGQNGSHRNITQQLKNTGIYGKEVAMKPTFKSMHGVFSAIWPVVWPQLHRGNHIVYEKHRNLGRSNGMLPDEGGG